YFLLPYLEGDTIYANAAYGAVNPSGTLYNQFWSDAAGSGNTIQPFKVYYAPLDSLAEPTSGSLSYGLNINIWVFKSQVPTAVAIIPGTFNPRGTSNTVAIAERTCQGSVPIYGRFWSGSRWVKNNAAATNQSPPNYFPTTAGSGVPADYYWGDDVYFLP